MNQTTCCFTFRLAIFFALFFMVQETTAYAQRYSTKNKKAIDLFEQAVQAPNQSVDRERRMPNFRLGIELAEKALNRDPNFWEAHLLLAEFHENYDEYEQAIHHYEQALRIHPQHAASGLTHFLLGSSQFLVGQYAEAIENLSLYSRNKQANPRMVNQAREMIKKSEFAIEAIAHPYKFEPINVGPGINTADPEYFPTITVDGKTILFTRRIKDMSVPMGMQEDFFISHSLDGKTWEKATPMPPNINTERNEGAPTIAADGRSLIFVACSDETGRNYGENRYGKGSCDLFYTKKIGTRWLDPINLPGKVNTLNWESQPSLSADGKTLYFIRRVSQPGEPTNSDIFVSHLQDDGKWGEAKALPNTVNTPYMEESVLIHPDGKTLYFASRGHVGMGGSDLFVSRMDKNGKWGPAVNLGYPINTQYDENSLMVSPTGEIAFFASDREGGYGNLDIYYFEMPESMRPTKTIYFEGTVFDALTRMPLPGKFELIDLKTRQQVITSEADRINGQFLVSLPLDREYALNVSLPGYLFFSQNFNMTVPENQDAFYMDIPLVAIDSDKPVLLQNIFFDLAASTLRPESFVELDKLYEFLKFHASVRIELSGHTDTRGDEKANLKLSQERANAVVDYLVKKGIDKDRLVAKGYGETQPILSDEQINSLPTEKEREAAHQANRRTEYKTLKN